MALKPKPNPITINKISWLPLFTVSLSYFPTFVPFSLLASLQIVPSEPAAHWNTLSHSCLASPFRLLEGQVSKSPSARQEQGSGSRPWGPRGSRCGWCRCGTQQSPASPGRLVTIGTVQPGTSQGCNQQADIEMCVLVSVEQGISQQESEIWDEK